MSATRPPDAHGCERCGQPADFATLDYCAVCSRDLCDKCMAGGCCGHAPAKSGLEADGMNEPSEARS